MKVPAKGKAVQYSYNGISQIFYSLGFTSSTAYGCLMVSEKSDGSGKRECLDPSSWQEVEITPVVHVPEEGKKVLCWNGDQRPKEPAIRRSAGVLCDGKLSIYDYVTPKGVQFGVSTAKHWEEVV